jgi:hypothetical protein
MGGALPKAIDGYLSRLFPWSVNAERPQSADFVERSESNIRPNIGERDGATQEENQSKLVQLSGRQINRRVLFDIDLWST